MMMPSRILDHETVKRLHWENNLQHKQEVLLVELILEEMMVLAMTDIWVYDDYPVGWHAVVGVEEPHEFGTIPATYIIKSVNHKISVEIQPMRGFRPNGSIIIH